MTLSPVAVPAKLSTDDASIWLREWGDGNAPETLKRVAAHESGHALTCIDEGLEFNSVSISGTDGNESGRVEHEHRFEKSSPDFDELTASDYRTKV